MRSLLLSLVCVSLSAASLIAAEPIDSLVKELGAPDSVTRMKAVEAIVAQGAAAVPTLTKLLTSESAGQRTYAAYALGRIGEPAKVAAPELVKLVADKEIPVRRAAIRALQAIKPDRAITLPLLAKVLEESDPSVVMLALQSIAEMGKDAVPALRDALKNPKAKFWALLVARDLGPVAAEALPEIMACLAATEEEIRMQAAIALAEMGPAAKPAAMKLSEMLKSDKHEGVKYAAAHALTRIGDQSATADLSAAAAGTQDALLKLICVHGIAQLNPTDAAAATAAAMAIADGLKSQDPKLRGIAAQALAESKIPSAIAAPVMEAALETATPEAIDTIIATIAKVGAPAVPRVVRGLASPKLRPLALRVLAQMGPASAGAAPALAMALAGDPGKDPDFRREAQFVLAQAGPAAAPAVPELIKSLASENEDVRRTAIFALGKIGRPAVAAVPALRQNAMAQEEKFEKLASIWALVKIQPDPPLVLVAIPVLTKALSSERAAVRAESARTLGELGPPAIPSVPAIKKLLMDPDPGVQAAAKEALGKLGG
jgi:HEAT repeat protein